MSKQLNVSLSFTADTESAKRQIQSLQGQLTQLINTSSMPKGTISNSLKLEEAISATAELKAHLQSAINIKTGNLDFSKFNESIRNSGKSLQDYGQHLQNLGPAGQTAFQALATSVANSEMPLRRSNALLGEMWVTLKNTARWQISSSILHGFMGALQGAYGYAQNLNESLNEIRIVTGQSVDQMALFAEKANKAAKALSTTTTEYTNASLIYYQQGLSDSEVIERTDITIKMANAAGESAEKVSDQLTAVWNNFYDGSKSLEYYADVMTALGAATASSTDEIAGGLEKFAAIGDTIGLSYEYAASALATITSNTRQSEEVVGTALKTIFARIQGLNLGETLEDGTTLNKYSEALQKVGISIFDSAGELKKMDTILDEMAGKWGTLSKAQQAALAQTVAGVRQYTQLIALMENWDNGDSDSMIANLNTAYNSTGALQEQADIYAESWEAAQDRVTAAAEAIYSSLLNDEFFIDLLNSLENILNFIDKFIDSVGGLGGVLTTLGTIITKVFHTQLTQGLQNAAYSMTMMTKHGQDALKNQRKAFIESAANSTSHPDYATKEDQARSSAMKNNLNLQLDLMESADRMSQVELETNKILIDRAKLLGDLKVKAAANVDKADTDVGNAVFKAKTDIAQSGLDTNQSSEEIRAASAEFSKLETKLKKGIQIKTNLPDQLRVASKEGKSASEMIALIKKEVKQLGNKSLTDFVSGLADSNFEGDQLEDTLAIILARINDINNSNTEKMLDLGIGDEVVDELTDSLNRSVIAQNDFEEATRQSEEANDSARKKIEESTGAQLTWADNLVNVSNTIMGVATAFQSFNSIIETIKNPDMSGWEKFTSILMSVAMMIPMLTMAFTKESVASLAAMSAAIAHALGLETEATAAMGAAAATGTFTGTLYTLLWPIGLVIAAITSLILIFKALDQVLRADEIAAEKAAATATELADAYDEAKTKHEQLMQSISDYEDAEKAMDILIEGTKEYQEALMAANQVALELMKNNPGKFKEGEHYEWVNGKIQFYEGALEQVQQESINTANTMYGAAQMGMAYSSAAQAEVTKNDVISSLEWDTMSSPIQQGYIAAQEEKINNTVNAGYGQTMPGQPTAADMADFYMAAHGSEDTSKSASEVSEETRKEVEIAADKIIDAYKDNPNILSGDKNAFTTSMQELGISNTEVIDALFQNRDALENAATEYANSTEVFNQAANLMVNSLLSNEAIANSDNKDAILSKMSDDFVDQYNSEIESLEAQGWGTEGISKATSVNEQATNVFQDYAEAANLSGASLVDTTGTDSNRVFKYDDGTGVIKEVSLEAMKAVVAASKANESINQTASNLVVVTDALDEITKKAIEQGDTKSATAAEGMKAAFLDGDFSSFTLEDLNLLEAIDPTEFLKGMFGENYEAELEKLGFNSAQEFIDAFTQGVTESKNDFNAAIESLGTDSPLKDVAQNASVSAVTSIMNQSEEAENVSVGNGQAFQENINEILGTVDATKQQEAFEALANIDWSKAGASEEAIKSLGRLGLITDETKQKILELNGEMRELNGANLDDLNTALDSDVDAEEYADLADFISSAAESSEDFSEDLQYNEAAAKKTAEAILRFNSAIEDVNENYDDWNHAMKNGTVQDQAKAVKQMRNAYADLLDIDMDSLSDDFITNTDNLELMKQAAEGSEEAYQKLQEAAGKDILAQIGIDTSQYETDLATINQLALDAEGMGLADIKAGASLDNTEFLQGLTDIVNEANMTAQEATDYLASMGVDAEVVTDTQTVTDTADYRSFDPHFEWETKTLNLPDILGGPINFQIPHFQWTSEPNPQDSEKSMTAMGLKVTSANKSSGGDVKYKNSTSGGGVNGPTGPKQTKKNSGGSSAKPKKAEKIQKEDVVERYKEIEDSLDDVSDAYDDASKAADRLYGAGRIAAMAKANAQLLKEIGLLKEKKKQAQEYLKLDRAEADRAAAEAGVTLKYDASGNIVNYTHELSHLVDEYNELVKVVNEDNNESEEEKAMLDEKKEKIDNLTKSIEKYSETQELIEDIDNEMRDKFYEWQDNNFEMWSHSLEVSLDITDDAKEVLDILLSRTEGDFFKQAEGLALMGGQLALVNVEMGSYIGHLGMLGGLMATGSISPADFVEGLGQVKDGAFAAAQAIFELDEQMIHYYGNALAMAREEIDLITDQLEHGTSVLEHYLSLMDLMGHQTDYKNRGIVLEGRVKTLKNELDSLQIEADYMNEEAEKKKRMLDRAILPTSAEVFKQQYEDALSAAMETQEEFLAKAEEYAEALNEQLENSLNAANQDLEDALTGGKSFDQLITGMERLVSLEEEYLTNTNKIYETEKLMNKAQQEIDKTTNTVAKQKLKQFIAETDQLKEKNKLSKFELDVQQAKYELLLAEIALEEAQNAKSQVRLQRDKEGNFGYVYTADASAISDAEQELADKQNEFYNIALEGINTYAEKYAQTLQEMYDTLTEIDQQYHEGAFASEEEYLAAREAAMTYYYDKLGQYSELYNIAIQLDSNATADAWGSDYEDMVNSTEQWKIATKTHADAVKATFGEWKMAMDLLASQTSTRMDQLASSVKKVTDESDELARELEEELMPKIEKEMSIVSQLTALYAALRIVVLGLAYAYMALGVAMTFCQMAASMGSMLGAVDFGGAADAIGQGASALGGAISDAGAKTSDSGTSTKSSGSLQVGDEVIYKGGKYYETSYGTGKSGERGVGGTVKITDYVEGREKPYHIYSEDSGYGWASADQLEWKKQSFATGGYTGEWGSYGKLAMLHEKELVLNAKDTENFLASMDLLDNIVSTIDLHAANQSIGGALNSPGLGAIGSDTLEQTVTIEANFPGVSSRTEIEEAFSTLVNRASQYANRK